MSQNKANPNDDMQEGQLPDDFQNQQPSPNKVQPVPVQSHPRQRSLSSENIIFEIVTEDVAHSEKKKKRIQKESKDKKYQKVKQTNRQKDKKVDKIFQNVKINNEREQTSSAPLFQPHLNPMPGHEINMQANRPPFYPPHMMHVNQHPANLSGNMFPMFQNASSQPYMPGPINNQYPFGVPNPTLVPQQPPQFRMNSYQPNRGYQINNFAPPMPHKPPMMPPNYGAATTDKQINVVKISQSEGSSQVKPAEYHENSDEKKLKKKNEKLVIEQDKKKNQASRKSQEKREKVNEVQRRKLMIDDIKSKVKRQLKGFPAQTQLNFMEAIRYLIKYSDEINSSKEPVEITFKECYERNIKFLELIIQENQDKQDNIKKILEALDLTWIWKDIQERRLYAWAMKDHNFKKMGQKYFRSTENSHFMTTK